MMKTLENIPDAPEILNEEGSIYWYNYAHVLLEREELCKDVLPLLQDLCYWEQQKEIHRSKLEAESAVHEYQNDDGSIKHTQASGWFSNLKAIQSKVDSLRKDLGFTIEKAKEQPPARDMRRKKNF